MFTDQIPTFSHIASFGMLRIRGASIDYKIREGCWNDGVLAREFTLCWTARDFCLILDSFKK